MTAAAARNFTRGFYAITQRRTLKVAGLFVDTTPTGTDAGFDAVLRFRLPIPATDVNFEAQRAVGQAAPGGEPLAHWLQVIDSATQGTSFVFLKRGLWHIQFGIGNRAATYAINAGILWNGSVPPAGNPQTDATHTITAAEPQYLSTQQLTVGTAGVDGILMEAVLPVGEWDLPRPAGTSAAAFAGKVLRFVANGAGIVGTQVNISEFWYRITYGGDLKGR